MEVVQDQHEGLRLGSVLQEGNDGVKKAEAGLLRLQGRRCFQVRQFTPYLRYNLGDVGGAGTHLRGKLFRLRLLDVGPHYLDPGPVGRRSFFFVAPAPKDLGALLFSEGCQLLGRAGLADARLSGQHHQPALAGQGIIQGRSERLHLPLAAYEYVAGRAVVNHLLIAGPVAGLFTGRVLARSI